MPYKVTGNKVMHLKGGEWSVKQTCSSHENAVSAMRLLNGVEHGMTPDNEAKKKTDRINFIKGRR